MWGHDVSEWRAARAGSKSWLRWFEIFGVVSERTRPGPLKKYFTDTWVQIFWVHLSVEGVILGSVGIVRDVISFSSHGDVLMWQLGVARGAFHFWKVLVSVRNLNGAHGFVAPRDQKNDFFFSRCTWFQLLQKARKLGTLSERNIKHMFLYWGFAFIPLH